MAGWGPLPAIALPLIILFGAPSAAVAAQPPRVEADAAAERLVRAKLTDVEREVAVLRAAGKVDRAEALARECKALSDALGAEGAARNLGGETGEAELHVVGVYEAGNQVVVVEDTGRPIVLALCAYDHQTWEVRVRPGVKLQKLILGGYHAQSVRAPAGVPVDTYTYDAGSASHFYAHQRDRESYPALVRTLKKLADLDVATFQGDYRFVDAGPAYVVGPSSARWRLEKVSPRVEVLHRRVVALDRARRRQQAMGHEFDALDWTNAARAAPAAELVRFMMAGPIDGTSRKLPGSITRIAVDPRGPTYYGTVGHYGLARIDVTAGAVLGMTELKPPANLPRLSWPCGVAFDTKRNRLVVVTLGGVGHMYSYHPDNGAWSLLGELNKLDLESFTYSEADDCFYGLGGATSASSFSVYRFDADGKLVGTTDPSPPIAGNSKDRHQMPRQLVSIGKNLGLLVGPPSTGRGGATESMSSLLIDPKTGVITEFGKLASVTPPEPGVGNEEVARRWAALRDASGAAAVGAARRLATTGDRAVERARAELTVTAAMPDPPAIRRLITQLDDKDWKRRDEAAAKLIPLGAAAQREIDAALGASITPEVRSRLEVVTTRLTALLSPPPAGAATAVDGGVEDLPLRTRLRAIHVLRIIGTPKAVECLQDVAGDSKHSIEAAWARRALEEL